MAERAYARAYAVLGNFYTDQVAEGRSAVVLPLLRVEEPNLTHAVELARAHQLPAAGLECLAALHRLYEFTGRDVEWARLVGEVEGDYIEPTTDEPLPGRDEQYGLVMRFRVQIARERRDWPTATRLQSARTAWVRDRAGPYLELPAERLDPTARYHISYLASSEHDLGRLLWEQNDPACVGHFQASYDLDERTAHTSDQAVSAASLGNAYLSVSGLRDLDQAQYWHQRSLDLKPEHDRIGQAASHESLANVAYQRFHDAQAQGAPEAELLNHLNTAHTGHQRALDLLPADHHEHRAVAHNQLGNVNSAVGDIRQALHHYQQAIQHEEARGNTYGAGNTRYNIALLFYQAGRPGDALHYARAALNNYRDVGPGASTEAQKAQTLISHLEQVIDHGVPDKLPDDRPSPQI